MQQIQFFYVGAAQTLLGELTALPRSIAGGEGADSPHEPIPVSALSWDGGVADPLKTIPSPHVLPRLIIWLFCDKRV